MTETDKDVSASISTVITELDKIEVAETKRGSPEGREITAATRDDFLQQNGVEEGKSGETSQGRVAI